MFRYGRTETHPFKSESTIPRHETRRIPGSRFYFNLSTKAKRLSGRLQVIDINLCGSDEQRRVEGEVFGPFAIHAEINRDHLLAVTHVKSGLKIVEVTSKEKAKELIVWLLDLKLKLYWNFAKLEAAQERTRTCCYEIAVRYLVERDQFLEDNSPSVAA